MKLSAALGQYQASSQNGSERLSWNGLSKNDEVDLTSRGLRVYRGKVRDLIFQGPNILMLHSDRLSAFDRAIGLVPAKGQILAETAMFWHELLQKHDVPIQDAQLIHPRIIRAESCQPFAVEVIVRGYLAGSMQRAYNNGERIFCGIALGDGLKDYQPLPQAIITPTTKAEVYAHDENTTAELLIKNEIVTKEEWGEISSIALRAFAIGQSTLKDKGYLLADTKYEFGRNSKGKIVIIDEAHTPDSSRFWLAESYEERLANNLAPEMLDKEIVRRWLMERGFKGEGDVPAVPADVLANLSQIYLGVLERLSGRQIDLAEPVDLSRFTSN